MILNEIWFVLFLIIIGGYLVLDGFDMGVGILHLPLARTDTERRTLLNSIGPVHVAEVLEQQGNNAAQSQQAAYQNLRAMLQAIR